MSKQLDEEFDAIWNNLDPLWTAGSKEDAKFFWLLGQRQELENTIGRLREAKQEVANAGNRS